MLCGNKNPITNLEKIHLLRKNYYPTHIHCI